MALITGKITVNNKEVLEVDVAPSSGGGTSAPVGSLALYNNLVSEVTRFVFSQTGSFYDVVGAGKALQLFNYPAIGHYFWIFVTGGANVQTDPALSGTGHQVSVLPGDTSAQVATKVFTEIALVTAAFTATNGVASQVVVTNVDYGNVTNASVTGTAAAVLVLTQGGEIGTQYIKVGPLDSDWDLVLSSSFSNNGLGTYLRLPIYDTNATGYHIDDTVDQNGFAIDVAIEAQSSRSVAIEYRIPNPGNAIAAADFVLTQGNQIISGAKTFQDNAVFNANLTVNGTLTYLNSTNTEITDKLITLNKGGAAASAGGSGLEFEENAVITAYFKVSADRNGYEFLAPNVAFKAALDLSNLTANRVQKLADTSGTFAMRPDATPFVANQIAYGQDANNLVSEAGFEYNPTTNVLSVPSITISGLGLGVVHSSAGGVLSSSPVVLTSEVSGILPIANGGTNSATALNNARLMYSLAGAIVEYPALVPNQVYFGAAVTGLPAQSANMYWDITNSRLGLGTTTPSRLLDVNGTSLFQNDIRIQKTGITQGHQDIAQAFVQTTTNANTTLADIAVPTDSELLIEARISAYRTGGSSGAAGDSAAYIRTARFKNIAGTVTIKTLQTDYTSEDQTAWDGTLVVSGTNARIQVKAATNNNVDWLVTYYAQILN